MNTESSNQPPPDTVKPPRRIAPMVVRILMGLAFFVFGLNGFLQFLPQPKELPKDLMEFMGGMLKSHYMMTAAMATQLIVGVLLLINRFVPLALTLIAPILFNIIAVHVFLQPEGIVPGAVLTIMELYLAWSYRSAFRPMLRARVQPD
jgi:uncharacterized membrane protein YphA (DoxX/SURF4 family)